MLAYMQGQTTIPIIEILKIIYQIKKQLAPRSLPQSVGIRRLSPHHILLASTIRHADAFQERLRARFRVIFLKHCNHDIVQIKSRCDTLAAIQLSNVVRYMYRIMRAKCFRKTRRDLKENTMILEHDLSI